MTTFTDVPAQDFLAIDGAGPASTPRFAAALEELKTALFAAGGTDVPLEGLWWTPGSDEPFGAAALAEPERWQWTLLVPAPAGAAPTGPVRLERLEEGRVAELLHVGPHDAEGPSIAALHEAIAAAGLRPRGRHHEIYLDDPRETAPEALRTVLRQPVA